MARPRLILSLPPQLTYARDDYPGAIPPNATLIFGVEVLGIGLGLRRAPT